ncbi:MAG: archease [Candidatus Cloacimonadota bacterium]|nr:MAG: archease [Candidatus Cloacimonadota bacterium]
MAKLGYRFIDHPSDVGMEVEGVTLEELFINAATGMLSIIAEPASRSEAPRGKPRGILAKEGKSLSKELHLKEDSIEELLHSFLSEILWFITKERFFPLSINIFGISKVSLDVKLGGIQLKEEEINGEVKAVTYHQLKIVRRDGVLFTKLILDV